ncbi:MAG: SufS family cysteine desulfurase [Oscillospiraceae bacterium]|jgi:cysteine desulfurase/selenocysteine lyase|nr:SufS family cysteine desulfurase [Oscillospiraceae bacterium]
MTYKISDDFPVLNQMVNGHRLVYLDSAATSMRPVQVLGAIDEFYKRAGANPHRGLYDLAQRSTEAYDGSRAVVASFVGADFEETIFTRNASESLNLVAYSYAPLVLTKGSNIVIPISEHHSNLVPWQVLGRQYGAQLRYLYVDRRTGEIPDSEIEQKIDKNTKIVAFAHVSNVLGGLFPLAKLVAAAKAVGAITILDCAQSIPHMKLDLHALDVDFAAFSGHKMYGPMGIGVLYGKRKLLEQMPPFLFGGDMIEDVREQETDFLPPPSKFEAGTQNGGGAVGLAAATKYIESVGWAAIEVHERALMRRLVEGLKSTKNVTVIGSTDTAAPRYGVAAFNVNEVHPHDAATILNDFGVAIRAGKHCAHPLLSYLDVEFNACCRASLGIYNTAEDVDALLEYLPEVRRRMNLGD